MCGLVLSAFAFWARSGDALFLIEVLLVMPCAALSGFVVARGAVELGMATGAATATTGHVTAVLGAVLYFALGGAWLISLAWLLMGAALILVPVVLGATLGALGAVLSRLIRTTRS